MALQNIIKSQQMLKRDSSRHQPLDSVEQDGRVRIAAWNFNTTDDLDGGTLAEAQSIKLVKLIKGTRVLRGRCWFEAMGTDQTADLGLFAADGTGYINAAGDVADDPDFFTSAAIAVAAVGEADFAVLQEDNPGYILEKDCWLCVTLDDTSSADAWAADKDFDGFVEFVTD
jgi:hypothetical protein